MHEPITAVVVFAAAPGEGGIMNVDTTLLLGTLVLFSLFAWVLAKFAWGPLLKIVDEREKTIREHVEGAEKSAADARALLAQHQEMLRAAGRERDAMLQQALKEAEQVRGEAVGRARAEAEHVVARAREQMQREKEQAILELRAQVADIAVEAASRIVKSSLSKDAQKKLVDDYIKELPSARSERQA
jgi:F-type H+-transporting ATPase subunit b